MLANTVEYMKLRVLLCAMCAGSGSAMEGATHLDLTLSIIWYELNTRRSRFTGQLFEIKFHVRKTPVFVLGKFNP